MNYKKLREEMTEQALNIETVLRGHPRVNLEFLCKACKLSQAEAEFILHQMGVFHITHETLKGCFSLTPEYLKTCA